MRIENKQQMYRLLRAGQFGNAMRVWGSIDSLESSDYRGEVSLRAVEASSPIRFYHVPFSDARATVERLNGLPLLINESPPDDKLTIQGEVMRAAGGCYLHYSYDPSAMKLALTKSGRHARGIEAAMILQETLTPSDYDALQELLDAYPDAVVEFSAFRVPVGVLPRRKMVVWEVRHY
jgi:hypothetical protein